MPSVAQVHRPKRVIAAGEVDLKLGVPLGIERGPSELPPSVFNSH